MEDIELQKGDIFVTRNPMALGRAINAIQRVWSTDNESTYSHAGIIIDPDGLTFESLWTVKRQNIWKAYHGDKVLIGRSSYMSPQAFEVGFEAIKEHEGDWYPFHRLFLHIIPPLAKYISVGPMVCSELVGRFLNEAEIPYFESYKGLNPDTIADRIERWKQFTVVF